MVKWFSVNEPQAEHLISYQDTAVHTGTIYKAAGWKEEGKTTERIRDRTKKRTGTDRMYRKNINGTEPDMVSKIRWGINIKKRRTDHVKPVE